MELLRHVGTHVVRYHNQREGESDGLHGVRQHGEARGLRRTHLERGKPECHQAVPFLIGRQVGQTSRGDDTGYVARGHRYDAHYSSEPASVMVQVMKGDATLTVLEPHTYPSGRLSVSCMFIEKCGVAFTLP